MNFWLGQALSAAAGLLMLLGIRTKGKLRFLVFSSLSNGCGFLAMLVLGAYSATVGPVILTLQGLVTYFLDKNNRRQPPYLPAVYVSLTVIGSLFAVESPWGILSVFSSSLACLMIAAKTMKQVRILNAVSAAIALPYLIISKAYVSAIVFVILFINALLALYQFDRRTGDAV